MPNRPPTAVVREGSAARPVPTPHAGEVRIGPLRPVAALLRERGIDPVPVLAACGLPPNGFDDPDRLIPFPTAACLLQQGGWAAGRADFGLLVGARLDIADLGLLGLLVQRAPTVGGALDSLARFLCLQDRGSVVYVGRPGGDTAALGYAIYGADTPGIGLAYDAVMAIAMTLLRGLCGPEFRAAEVQLPHTAPADRAPYRRFFGAPVTFDAPHAEIRFDARWLQARSAGAEADIHALARHAAGAALAGTDRGLTEVVRGVVYTLVLSGSLTGPAVATALGLHERTLRRRLDAEGSGLTALVAEARFAIARQLLLDTRLTLAELAEALGYADATAFARAFRGWAGITPGQWRAGQGGGHARSRHAGRR